MALELQRRRFTVEEYQQMARVGILGDEDRVELLDGEIIEMTPIERRHAQCVVRIADIFHHLFADAALVSVQNPVRLGETSEPQPDLALLRRHPDPYAHGHPAPENLFLLVEVSDSTVDLDRRIKLPLYALANVPEVWLVDLGQETITTYWDPTPRGYRAARFLHPGDLLAPTAFPDRTLAVVDLLPK